MTAAVILISTLLNASIGKAPADDGPARRIQLTIAAALAALAFAALWGIAAGSTSTTLALGNAVKVPMVVLLSAVASVPAGMLALRLTGMPYSGRDLLFSFAPALFAGTLALAVTWKTSGDEKPIAATSRSTTTRAHGRARISRWAPP